MSSIPQVSVFIASYNHARYLSQCLDSILAQTYRDFEIVIVDDGSTDGSHEILMDYQRRFPNKVHYYWHPEHSNRGVSATSNLAIAKSQGKYLAWTGSDDVWYPEKLECQINRLEQDSLLGAVYSYADLVGEDGQMLPGRAGTDVTLEHNSVGEMLQFCHPPAMTLVFRRQCLNDVGLFDESLVYSDWDLMIRVFARWKVGFIDRSLAKYRIHNNNLSKRIDPKIDLSRILTFYNRLEQKALQIGGALLEPRNQAILDLQLAFHLFCADKQEEAITRLHSAFQHDPSLYDDVAFFNRWLNNWKPDFYTLEHNHFGFWVIAHLPSTAAPGFRSQLLELQLQNPETQNFFVRRGIQRGMSRSKRIDMSQLFDDCPDGFFPYSWKVDVLKKVYPTLMFEHYKKRNLHKTRYYWWQTIQLDQTWLRNRGVWAIGLRSFFS